MSKLNSDDICLLLHDIWFLFVLYLLQTSTGPLALWQNSHRSKVLAGILKSGARARDNTARALVEATKETRPHEKIGGYIHTLEMFIEPHHAHAIPPDCPEAVNAITEVQSPARNFERFS